MNCKMIGWMKRLENYLKKIKEHFNDNIFMTL